MQVGIFVQLYGFLSAYDWKFLRTRKMSKDFIMIGEDEIYDQRLIITVTVVLS